MFKRGNKKSNEKSNDKDEIAELQQHIHELEEEGKQKKIQLDRLEAELDDREEALEQKNGSLAHFSSQLKERETQEEKLVEQIAKLKEEQETARQKLRIESQEVQSLKEELVQSAKVNTVVNTEADARALAELQQSLDVEESCAAQLQARNLELSSKLVTSQNELQESHAAVKSEYCQQVDRLRSECASLESAVQDKLAEARGTEQQLVDAGEHAQKPAPVKAIGEQENSTVSKHLENAGQLLSPDLTTPQADCQSVEARLLEDVSNYQELQDELEKLREEMYVLEEERDDAVDRAVEAENQLAEERRNLECAQLESNDASRERDVELQRLRECKDANITLEKRLAAALQDVTDRDMMLAAKEGDQRLALMQQALEQQQELYTQSEEKLSREEASAHALHHEFSGAETELVAARLATDGIQSLKEQLQSELSGLTSDLDLARHRMNEVESREQVSSATLEHVAEEHATAVAAIEMQSSKVTALQDELLHAESRLSSGDEVNAKMAASLQEQSEKENLAVEEQNIARSHAKLAERLGVEVAEERSIAQSQVSMLEDRLAAMGQELNQRSETLAAVGDEKGRCLNELNERSEALAAVRDENGRRLNEALAAEQEQRAYLQSQLSHVEDRLATNESNVVMQRLSEELDEARSNSIEANSRVKQLGEELLKERSRTNQTCEESLVCSKHVEQVPRLAEAKLHSQGRDTNASDTQTWEVDRLRIELVEERRCADRLKRENADLERDMVDLVKMLNELKAAVRQYAVSGAVGT